MGILSAKYHTQSREYSFPWTTWIRKSKTHGLMGAYRYLQLMALHGYPYQYIYIYCTIYLCCYQIEWRQGKFSINLSLGLRFAGAIAGDTPVLLAGGEHDNLGAVVTGLHDVRLHERAGSGIRRYGEGSLWG